MKILITGGTGFIGKQVIRELSKNVEYKLFCITRRPNSYLSKSNVSYINYQDALKFSSFDLLIHMATDYGRNNKEMLSWVNFELPSTLISNIDFGFVINFDTFFTRNSNYNYLNSYTESKIKIKNWFHLKEVSFCNLMLFHVYGVSHFSSGKFFDQIYFKMVGNEIIELTTGENYRDFISVEMVSKMIEKIVNEKLYLKYKEIEIGTGVNLTVRDFVIKLKHIMKSKSQLRFGALESRKNEINIPPAKLIHEFKDFLNDYSIEKELAKLHKWDDRNF